MAKKKITLNANGTTHKCMLPYPGAKYVLAKGFTCCSDEPHLRVPSYVTKYDSLVGNAVCIDCESVVGVITVVIKTTIFGLEEDALVLAGRCRVY